MTDPMLPRDESPNGREPMLPSFNASDIRSTGFAGDMSTFRRGFGLPAFYFIEVAGWRDPAPPEPSDDAASTDSSHRQA